MPTRCKTLYQITILCMVVLFGAANAHAGKTAGEHVDDVVVTTKVKAALVQAEDVDALEISVNTNKGVVQLSGFVDSESEAQRAAEVAGTVDGVERVENDLEVDSGG